MSADMTQTYAKAVRDLAEAAQMIRGATTAQCLEARMAVEKATKNVADLMSAERFRGLGRIGCTGECRERLLVRVFNGGSCGI